MNSIKIQKMLNDAFEKMKKIDDKIKINNISESIIKQLTSAEHCSIWKLNKTNGTLIREKTKEFVREISVEKNRGLLVKATLTQKAKICKQVTSDKEYDATVDNPDNVKIKSLLLYPLLDKGVFTGIVAIYNTITQDKDFTQDDLEMLNAMRPFLLNILNKMYFEGSYDRRKFPRDNNKIFEKRSDDFITEVQEIRELRKNVDSPVEVFNYVSTVANDIKIPSYNLRTFLQILEREIKDPNLIKHIQDAKNSAELIDELTGSILDRVYTHRKRKSHELKSVNSIKYISDIADMFSSIMYDKNIDYNIFIDPLLPKEIFVDNLKLKKIILNLISNAYKYTPKDGLIEFLVRVVDDKIHFIVKDNGIGIVDEKQKEILYSFKDAHTTQKIDNQKSEFGLSASACYVKELGGELTIKSTLDVGSDFSFNIDLKASSKSKSFDFLSEENVKLGFLGTKADVDTMNHMFRYLVSFGLKKDTIAVVQNIEDLADNYTHVIVFESKLSLHVFANIRNRDIKTIIVQEKLFTVESEIYDVDMIISKHSYYGKHLYTFVKNIELPRVLVVDDDRISLSLIKNMLSEVLCEVETASDGAEGLAKLQKAVDDKTPYDIVFLDEYMPNLKGSQVIVKYKEYEERVDTKKIFSISISGDVLTDEHALKSFNRYLGKPFMKKDIQDVVLSYKK